MRQERVEFLSFGFGTAYRLGEDRRATGLLQRIELQVQGLLSGTDTGIAKVHASSGSEKSVRGKHGEHSFATPVYCTGLWGMVHGKKRAGASSAKRPDTVGEP